MENNALCQTMLLLIDDYLDKELTPGQEQSLLAHTRQCAACGAELEYAMTLHQQVTQLPLMDCPTPSLEPIERLRRADEKPATAPQSRRWNLADFFGFSQHGFSVAMGGALAVALAVGFALGRMGGDPVAPTQIAQGETSEQYTQAEIVRAMEDMETAISYLQEVTARTGSLVESQLLEQVRIQINASSPEDQEPGARNGPI